MNYDLVIWDFDGTLADTLSDAVTIYNDLAREHGLLPIEDGEAARDMTIVQFLRAHRIPYRKVPFLMARFLATQKQSAEPPRVFPGIASAVHGLKAAGIRLGIVSSNDPETIARCLRQEGLTECFEFRVGCSRLFGKHRALRKAVRDAGVPVQRTLYVGDEVRDITAARKVGIGIATVIWGLNSAGLLHKFEPDHEVDEPGKLLRICGVPGETLP
jgi:phosphoglycolate phosphatase